MEEEFIKNHLTDLHCGYCGQQCSPDNVKLLERKGALWLLSVYCDSCKKQGFITAVIKGGETTEAHIELTGAETEKLTTPVTSDDILDMHTFLKDFEGDFSQLFYNEGLADGVGPQPQPDNSDTREQPEA